MYPNFQKKEQHTQTPSLNSTRFLRFPSPPLHQTLTSLGLGSAEQSSRKSTAEQKVASGSKWGMSGGKWAMSGGGGSS
jgi:hypothetical protein